MKRPSMVPGRGLIPAINLPMPQASLSLSLGALATGEDSTPIIWANPNNHSKAFNVNMRRFSFLYAFPHLAYNFTTSEDAGLGGGLVLELLLMPVDAAGADVVPYIQSPGYDNQGQFNINVAALPASPYYPHGFRLILNGETGDGEGALTAVVTLPPILRLIFPPSGYIGGPPIPVTGVAAP